MHVNLDPRNTLHVARQPIFDPSQQVFGYELLYRETRVSPPGDVPTDVTAARLLTDALLALGLDTITGGMRAFVPFTRGLLVSGAADVLPPKATVLELHDIGGDAEVIEACQTLRAKGYTLALDDFAPGSEAEHLLPHATFVKVNVLATPTDVRAELARQMRPRGLQLIAKNVETAEMAREVRGAGYGLVQGYFFCKPTTFSAKGLSARRIVYLKLLAALNRPNVSVTEVEELVKHDVSMSYRVLRCINSAAFGVLKEISSIRQAIMLLGLDQIRRWASIWALAGVNQGGTHELANVAILRARCCELLAQTLTGTDASGEYFLLGLCSLLDTMLGQPMDKAIVDLPVRRETRDALLGQSGLARSVLDAVIAYERGAWDAAAEALQDTGLNATILRTVYTEALRWARDLSRDSLAA